MLFNSPEFIFLFLPIAVTVYYSLRGQLTKCRSFLDRFILHSLLRVVERKICCRISRLDIDKRLCRELDVVPSNKEKQKNSPRAGYYDQSRGPWIFQVQLILY